MSGAITEPAAGHYIRIECTRAGRYRAVCRCGQYRSKKAYFYPGLAEAAGWDHYKAHSATQS